MINFIGGMVIVSVVPMALQLTDETQVGFMLSAGAVGALLGGAFMAITGGPKRKVNGIIGGTLMMSLFLFLLGYFSVIWMITLALLFFNVCLPIAFGSEKVIWQYKIEPSLQGRVFSVYCAISSITIPIGSYSAGLLADKIFEPMVTKGNVMGMTTGGGLALMLMCMSVVVLLIALWAWSKDAIMNIEDDLPDMIGNQVSHQRSVETELPVDNY
jgi:hypothetical protein